MMIKKLVSNICKVKQFAQLQVLNTYLSVNKYPFVMVYFTAKWNPACKIADQHVNLVSDRFNQIQLIKVDSDVSPQITSHYNVRAEPQFVFCLNGDEVIRQTGTNKQKLLQKCEMMMEIGKKGDIDSTWTSFGTKFQKFYKKAGRTNSITK